jgi:hypothetical protein
MSDVSDTVDMSVCGVTIIPNIPPVQRRGTARAGWHASDSRLSPSLRMGHTRRPGTVRLEPGRERRLDENVHLLADIQ